MSFQIKVLLVAFCLHFIADFLLQSRDMGKNKSSDPMVLAAHIAIQISVVFLGLLPLIGLAAIPFSLMNGSIHGLIDWNIWRGYKLYAYRKIKATAETNQGRTNLEPEVIALYAKDFQYWEDHWFYATIGFDQLLHISTLTVLVGLLVN